MKSIAFSTRFSSILIPLFSVSAGARAAVVQIDYVLESGVAEIDPISVPNPNGGADIVISPMINITSGSFSTQMPSDSAGVIQDGRTRLIDVTFDGEISIALSSSIEVFGFPIPVSAALEGPLVGVQTTDAEGELLGLASYADTSPGLYRIVSGPMDCTDNVFGAFCTAIETLLGVTFPITQIAADGTPVPFAGGTFSDVNGASGSGPSTFSASLEFSIPIDEINSLGTGINFLWVESDRTLLVPEPSSWMVSLGAALMVLMSRKRSNGLGCD